MTQPPRPRRPLLNARSAILIALFVLLCQIIVSRASADLSALWLAGEVLREGRPDLVYPPDTTLFTMLPPPEWFARQAARGSDGDVFPYLYPPLWAALAARLGAYVDLSSVLMIAGYLNPVLLAGCLILAHRIARTRIPQELWLAIGLVALMGTMIGYVAVLQDQPQILVAFLTLLAIERAESGAPRSAGAILALAAAIKVFPALVALIWLFGRSRRAAVWFALFGAVIGLLSILLAGWPLHLDFLRMMQVLSGTAVITVVSYSIDSVLLQLLTPGGITFIANPARDPVDGGVLGWNVLPKPALVTAAGAALQLVTILLAARALRTARDTFRRAAIWAAALTCLALVGPVGWSYYYIAPATFLPLLIVWHGPLRGTVILSVLIGAISLPTLALDLPGLGAVPAAQLAGVVMTVAMAVLFSRAGAIGKARTPR